jgi:SAM-dependent methyltransferase
VSESFYRNARLYDLMFPAGPQVRFYVEEARRARGRVLELAGGTGRVLLPIAAEGLECVGLDLSPEMLAEARRKAKESGVEVRWLQGDMSDFELGERFDLIFVASNSLLHLHAMADLVSCFQAVRRHLAPSGRFVFDVFNPSVRLLADAD